MWPKILTNYSPNFNAIKRSKKNIKFIIIHYTGMKYELSALKRLCNIKAKVSAHFFIKKNGSILNLVPPLYEAWHAGKSSWKGLKSLNRKVESLFGRALMGLEYLLFQSGPVTMGASQVCGFAKSDPSRETPNLQFHVSPVSTDILGVTPMHDFEGITPTVANIRPTSRGEINIVSSDSREYPKIKMNYLSTQDDRYVAAQGLKLVRKIMMETKTFKPYQPEEYRPGLNITDDEELVKAASDYAQTIFHPVGTCKMGNDDEAVVSDKLSVHGLQNLRVVDASIMPNITSGNTNAPTIMIAEKASDMILNK